MTTTTHTPHVVVIGGGIAGLVAAIEARELGDGPVTLVDGGAGRARTSERDGVLLNEGPHALYLGGTLATALRSWGIDPTGGTPPLGDYWAVRGDGLTRLPTSPRSLATTRLLGLGGKVALARLQLQLAKLEPDELAGTTVADWLDGLPTSIRSVTEALVRVTTYVNAPELLDAGAAVRQLQLGVSGGVRYLDRGWATIVHALHARLRAAGVKVVTGRVRSVRVGDGPVTIELADGSLRADAAVLATGGPAAAAGLLGIDLPAQWDLTPAEVSSLDVWATHPPRGSLILDLDRALYLSAHAPRADLAPTGVNLVAVAHYLPAGGAPPDHRTEQALLRQHAARAGLTGDVILGERYLHRMTVVHGFPTAERRGIGPGVEVPGIPRVFVAGDWVDAGAMLADASAASAREAAGAAVAATPHLAGADHGRP